MKIRYLIACLMMLNFISAYAEYGKVQVYTVICYNSKIEIEYRNPEQIKKVHGSKTKILATANSYAEAKKLAQKFKSKENVCK